MKSKLFFFEYASLRITHLSRNAYLLFMGLLLTFAASCSPTTATPAPKPSPEPSATAQATPTLTVFPTSTPTSSPTPTPTPKPCSPLGVLSLQQIPEYITQPFIAPALVHDAEHPEWVQKDDGHHGTDIGYYQIDGKLFTGSPVLAALTGQIAAIIHDRPPYGNMLIIETPFTGIPSTLIKSQQITNGSSLYTLYAHLQNMQDLKLGQAIACGEQIAETGLTGFSGGPHLHFETRWGPPAQTFTSMAYYRADASAEELKNYITWRMSAVFHVFDAIKLLAISS